MKPVRATTNTTDRVREQLPLALCGTYAIPDNTDWDYATADTKTHTHCYHLYPAMMIPQVARRLIRLYGNAGELLLDPFCGSGTSLVEARLAGLDAIGIDLNPFAVFLARAKVTDFELDQVVAEAKVLRARLEEWLKSARRVPPPNFYNIDYWFKPEAQEDLALLRYAIDQCISEDVRDFFLVAFAATVRASSNTRRGEYKLFRMPESALAAYRPQVFPTFWEKVERNVRGLCEFLADRVPRTTVSVYEADSRHPLPIASESVGLIVTSPPYGDSQTTVAYGQFSRLMLQWLGFPDEVAKSIDRRALGGQSRSTQVQLDAPTLESVMETIAHQHPRRAAQVYQFYADFAECLPELTRVVKPLGYACFVVGNRTVKGVRIPTDQILIEIAESFGWRHITTYHRRIPNKRMPLRNSPSNRPGDWGDTMTHEHIVILQKR
ncbi:MAG: DNA methyltransferase [Armatimonadetes bacterium JP3_11]|nr:MAG: DNA methyltransferase [Armatimonadetes bacterium JP3_11]RMH09229.1 MAG: DNA methyltransferase [Armatimonadota bacterium]